jgi:Tol biopolymer transport system component
LQSEERQTLPAPSLEAPEVELSTELIELLILWGKLSESVSSCQIYFLNPVSQQQWDFTIPEQDCNYQVVTINGKQYLASHPSFLSIDDQTQMELVLYTLTSKGQLEIKQKFTLSNIQITHPPQWDNNGHIYLSGIHDNREQIYLFNTQTETLVPYIDASNGFSSFPILSPDQRYIAYQVVANHESQVECGDLTCFEVYYHIWDTEANTDLAILPLIEPYTRGEPHFVHCDLQWSPTGQFIAFTVGCGLQTPASIIIFDVFNQQLVEIINSQDELVKSSWVSEDEIIIRGNVSFALSGETHEGYMIFSANSKIARSFVDFSIPNQTDLDKIFYQDWGDQGTMLVGTTVLQTEDVEQRPVVIILDTDDGSTVNVSQPNDTMVVNPTWSPSGNLIAYRSYNWDTRNTRSEFTIINRKGEILLHTGMITIFAPEFSWFLQEH